MLFEFALIDVFRLQFPHRLEGLPQLRGGLGSLVALQEKTLPHLGLRQFCFPQLFAQFSSLCFAHHQFYAHECQGVDVDSRLCLLTVRKRNCFAAGEKPDRIFKVLGVTNKAQILSPPILIVQSNAVNFLCFGSSQPTFLHALLAGDLGVTFLRVVFKILVSLGHVGGEVELGTPGAVVGLSELAVAGGTVFLLGLSPLLRHLI